MASEMAEKERFLQKLIIGMELESFFFTPSYFTLLFGSDDPVSGFPFYIKVRFADFWWFGEESDWTKEVASSGKGIDPEISLQSSYLTVLCTSEKRAISAVELKPDFVRLLFTNGMSITSVYPSDDCDLFFMSISDGGLELNKGEDLFEGTHEGIYCNIEYIEKNET